MARSTTSIHDDRKIRHWQFDEPFRAMQGSGVEQDGVARPQAIAAVAMPIIDLTGEHIDKFHAGVLESRKRLGILLQRDHIWFDHDVAADDVTEHLIDMANLRSAPLDHDALLGAHE